MTVMKGYLLDTNIFNQLLDGDITVSDFGGQMLFATHVQSDELQRTKNVARAADLLAVITSLAPNDAATTTGIWGDSRWGHFKWSDGERYSKLLSRLQELDALSNKRVRDPLNQSRDARLAETAIENDLTFVSGDQNLVALTKEFGGSALDPRDLKAGT
jgi:hypothetical protein